MKDFKMIVPEGMREEIQRKLFAYGCYGEDINKNDCNFIIVHNMEINMGIYDGHNITNFLYHPIPEITLTEFMELTEPNQLSNDLDKRIDDILDGLDDPEKLKKFIDNIVIRLRGTISDE